MTSAVHRLDYSGPFDFRASLEFLRARALPGVEEVRDESYCRLISADGKRGKPGWMRVTHWPGGRALKLELRAIPAAASAEIIGRTRRMFDLDLNRTAMRSSLGGDPQLGALLRKRPGLRIPGGWDGFEIAVRAVVGQQVSVAAARTLVTRLIQRFGKTPSGAAGGVNTIFPSPDSIAEGDLEGIGLTRARAATLRAVAAAILDRRAGFDPSIPLEEFVSQWIALPGIGPWTAHYIALRALGHADAFPAEDLILRRIAGRGAPLTSSRLRARAERWRPWRSYAVIHLWAEYSAEC